jgi:hypothetical protein
MAEMSKRRGACFQKGKGISLERAILIQAGVNLKKMAARGGKVRQRE